MSIEHLATPPDQDPLVFKHLSPKTQHYIRQANRPQSGEGKKEVSNMSNEQTSVPFPQCKPIAVELMLGIAS